MKRSDMLAKIRETLEGRVRMEDYAEEILSTVEDLGMNPPLWMDDSLGYNRATGDNYFERYEWEPENE